jgi:DNA-binding GntR family transcriptional regulator
MAEGVVVAREQLARQLDCAEGSRWLRFAGLRYRREDDKPLCWTEVLLAEPLIAEREAIRAESGPFFERVRKIRGLTADVVEQTVSATVASKEMAAVLDCPEGAPALLVRRRYLGPDGAPFEISLSIHPADRYVSQARLTRRRSSAPIGGPAR